VAFGRFPGFGHADEAARGHSRKRSSTHCPNLRMGHLTSSHGSSASQVAVNERQSFLARVVSRPLTKRFSLSILHLRCPEVSSRGAS